MADPRTIIVPTALRGNPGRFYIRETDFDLTAAEAFTITVVRAGRTDQVVTVDWADSTGTSSPASGTVTFQLTETSQTVNITSGNSTEAGSIKLSNPQFVSGEDSDVPPILGANRLADISVTGNEEPGGEAIFTQVKTPPFIMTNNTYTITTKDELENGTLPWETDPIKRWVIGTRNNPDGWHYHLINDGTRDIKVDLSGEPEGTWLQHPIHVIGAINTKIIGCRWEPSIFEYQQVDNDRNPRELATDDYPFPKYPWTMPIRIKVVNRAWIEGTVIDLAHPKNYITAGTLSENPSWEGILAFNSDYLVWRSTARYTDDSLTTFEPDSIGGGDAEYLDAEVYYCNNVFKGVQGSAPGGAGDTMAHADFFQNQGGIRDAPTRPSLINVENFIGRNGQEGFVIHYNRNISGNASHRMYFKISNASFTIGGEFPGPFRRATGNSGMVNSSCWNNGVVNDGTYEDEFVVPYIENLNYTSWSNGDGTPFTGVVKVDKTTSNVWLGDMKHDGLSLVIGHPEIHEFPWAEGTVGPNFQGPGFVTNDTVGLGPGYVSPWQSYHDQDS